MRDLEEWIAKTAEATLRQTSIVSQIAGWSSLAAGILGNTLLVLIGGAYLAAQPQLYREGLLMLFPDDSREEAAETLSVITRALQLWLLGQLTAMLLVGTLVALGLWMLGVPSALALGVLAGLLEFVPFVGPVVAAVPAVAVALAEGMGTALWVAALYFVIQQGEGLLITPLIQQGAVSLPPALTLFSIVAFGVLFGPTGVLFATPLAVLAFVAVKKLWIRDALHEETELPGEEL